MLLQLRPALLQARRGPGCRQIGADPERGVVLSGLGPADDRLIDELDGTRDLDGVVARGLELGVPEPRTRQLVAALARAGVLLARTTGAERRPPRRTSGEQRALSPDARVLTLVHPRGDGWGLLARRWRSTVRVLGGTRTGLAVALGLAGAGVGRVLVVDSAAVGPDDVCPGGYRIDDLGHPRAARAALLLRARCPLVLTEPAGVRGRSGAGRSGDEEAEPDAVVLVAGGAAPPAVAERLVSAGTPHLLVLWREGTVVVGPLVRPGATACLTCLDHHRADRDPEWPDVVAQLASAGAVPEETSLTAVAASLAVAQVLGQLDGVARPAALGATLEVSLPVSGVIAREWHPHARCGCTWAGLQQGSAGTSGWLAAP